MKECLNVEDKILERSINHGRMLEVCREDLRA